VPAGLAGAVIGGTCEALLPASTSEFLQQQYFHYQLYATGFQALAGFIDRWLPYTLTAALLLAMACRTGGLKRRWQRRLLQTGLLLAAAGLAAYYLYRTGRWPALLRAIPPAAAQLKSLLLGPAGLVILLFIMVWVLWRLRRPRVLPAGTARGERQEPATHRPRGMLRMAAIRGAQGLIMLLAAVAIVVNCAAWVLPSSARRSVQTKPNIIFIMLDTLRADHLGCYGYDLPTTPNIDRFARESTRFQHAVSQAPYTLWSVASLMSSCYPETLFPADIEGSCLGANLTQPTLAEFLHDRGYATAAIISNPLLDASSFTMQGYDSYDDRLAHLAPETPTSEEMTRAAIKRVSAMKTQPFFLSLVYMDPHQPYVLHPQFVFGESACDSIRRNRINTAYPRQFPLRRKTVQAYDSEIAFTDYHIGLFLQELKRQGLYDDACIVFFSDHGEEFLDHGSWGHRWTLYEEAIQVPLIVKLPHQRQGRVVTGAFPLIDLVPSLLSSLDYDPSPLKMSGTPNHLASLLHCADKPIYSTALEGVQSVKNGTSKYICNFDPDDIQRVQDGKSAVIRVKRTPFYDLTADPLEQHNLNAAKPAGAVLLSGLLQKHDSTLYSQVMKGAPKADKAMYDRLKSLGYLSPGATPTLVKDGKKMPRE